jgi:hypothetical protein
MFEDRVLTRVFGPKRKEVIGGWRNMDNKVLHNLSSQNIIMAINSSRM